MTVSKKKDEKEKTSDSIEKPKTEGGKESKNEKHGFTLTIAPLAFDNQFKLKAPLLVLILLLSAFSGYMFQAANLHTVDLVDIQRLQFSAAKLYSLSFILFLLLYGLVLALAMHFGHGQNWFLSLLTFAPAALSAVVLGVLFPPYLGAFVAFAFTVGAASFFATRVEKLNLSGAWNTAGRALLVLAVLAFVVTFVKVNANPQYYSDRLLNSAVALVPEVSGQVAEAVKNVQVDESFLRGAITKETFASSISTESVQSAIETIPGLSSFNASIRKKWAETVKTSLTSNVAYNQFIALGTQTIQNAKSNLADQIKDTAATESVAQGALMQVKKLPAFKQVTDNFGLVLAFLVLSLISVVNFVIKIVATVLAWALGKLAFS